MDGANVHPHLPGWDAFADSLAAGSRALKESFIPTDQILTQNREDPQPPPRGSHDAFYIILPLLIVLSTFLFLLLLFLLCVILLRRRRGIALRDHDGPVDMSREDLIEGEGGFDGVESRWLESVNELVRRTYLRAKGAYPVSIFVVTPVVLICSWLFRISGALPAQLYTNRYHPFPIFIHPREGGFGMVFRARL